MGKQKSGKLYIGTSGWVYPHWEGIFYPKDLPSNQKLRFYSEQFKTAEINYSFYHLPRPSTYNKWYLETPKGFVFSVKASRYITHIKRLKGVKTAWKTFLESSFSLKEKLGPILFQFPSSFQATSENKKRLTSFLEILTRQRKINAMAFILRYAVEFRHKSWCNKEVYKLLKKYNIAWVIADSPRYPRADEVTADFVYIRMHGSQTMFSSSYSERELKGLAQKIKKWLRHGLDVYVYFNNDFGGYAVQNAKDLKKMLASLK